MISTNKPKATSGNKIWNSCNFSFFSVSSLMDKNHKKVQLQK